MTASRIIAEYLVETPATLEAAAASIAGEQSTGTFTKVPGETADLAAARPADVARLEARLAALAAASVEPMQWDAPFQGAAYECASCPKHPPGAGPLEPWEAWIE